VPRMAERVAVRDRPLRTRLHTEEHTHEGVSVRDVVLGVSDGLTVPFALAAGLIGAVTDNFIVFLAGIAEMLAGGSAMGLGGDLSEKSHAEIYRKELERERFEVDRLPEQERREVRDTRRGAQDLAHHWPALRRRRARAALSVPAANGYQPRAAGVDRDDIDGAVPGWHFEGALHGRDLVAKRI